MTLSHEKAVRSVRLLSLFYSAYLTFSVYRPITRTEVLMKTIAVATLSKTTPQEPMLEHAIRLRAFELYAHRGMTEGHAVQDWLEAEAELLHSR